MLRHCFIALIGSLFAVAAHAQDGPRLALLIGNEDYPAEVGALSQPHQDVAALQAALVAAGFTVTPVLDADEDAMNEAVLAFSRQLNAAGRDAVGFFYYAGHGASANVAGRRQNFLMPARESITDAQSARLYGVQLDDVIETLGSTQARAVFVVSDACRNTLQWSDVRGERGFAPVSRRPGMFIALSTSEDATAPDDGLFAAALARRLSQPGLTAERVFTLTFREVFTARGDNRLPTAVGALREDFCFISCPGETPAQPVPSTAAASTDQIVFSAAETPCEYAAFARDYADSPLALIARQRAGSAPPCDESDTPNGAPFSGTDENEENTRADEAAERVWERVRHSNDPSDLQQVIDAYPNSDEAELARARIDQLTSASRSPEAVFVAGLQADLQELLANGGPDENRRMQVFRQDVAGMAARLAGARRECSQSQSETQALLAAATQEAQRLYAVLEILGDQSVEVAGSMRVQSRLRELQSDSWPIEQTILQFERDLTTDTSGSTTRTQEEIDDQRMQLIDEFRVVLRCSSGHRRLNQRMREYIEALLYQIEEAEEAIHAL